MRANTLLDAIDCYDYIKANCADHPIFDGKWDLKTWFCGSAVSGSLYFARAQKRITAIFFGWPVEAIEEDEKEPGFAPEGDIFYVPFFYSPKKKEDFPSLVAAMATEVWPNLKTMVFVERQDKTKTYKAYTIEEPVAAAE